MNATVAASAKKDTEYDRWQARDDMDTILRAEQIKADPTRMKHAKRAAKEKLAEMGALKKLAA